MRIPHIYTRAENAKKLMGRYAEEVKDDVYLIRGSKEFYFQTRSEMVDHHKDYIVAYHRYGKGGDHLTKLLHKHKITPQAISNQGDKIVVLEGKTRYTITIQKDENRNE